MCTNGLSLYSQAEHMTHQDMHGILQLVVFFLAFLAGMLPLQLALSVCFAGMGIGQAFLLPPSARNFLLSTCCCLYTELGLEAASMSLEICALD